MSALCCTRQVRDLNTNSYSLGEILFQGAKGYCSSRHFFPALKKKIYAFLSVKSLQHYKPRQWSAQISGHLYTLPALWPREIWPLSTQSVILALSHTHLYYFTLSTPPRMGPSHIPLPPPASHEPFPPTDPSTITVIGSHHCVFKCHHPVQEGPWQEAIV